MLTTQVNTVVLTSLKFMGYDFCNYFTTNIVQSMSQRNQRMMPDVIFLRENEVNDLKYSCFTVKYSK